MLPPEGADRIQVAFDDHRLVAMPDCCFCPASTISAGWRQSVLPVHLLGLASSLGCDGAVAGHVKLQDDGVMDHPVNRRGRGHGVGGVAGGRCAGHPGRHGLPSSPLAEAVVQQPAGTADPGDTARRWPSKRRMGRSPPLPHHPQRRRQRGPAGAQHAGSSGLININKDDALLHYLTGHYRLPCQSICGLFAFPAATLLRRAMYPTFLHFVDNSSISLMFKVRMKASLLGTEPRARIA